MKLQQNRLFGFKEGEGKPYENRMLRDVYSFNGKTLNGNDLQDDIKRLEESWAEINYHSFYVESYEIDTEGKEFIETIFGGRYVKEYDQLTLQDGRKAEVSRIGKRGKVYINIFDDEVYYSIKRYNVPLSNRLDEQGEWKVRN
jgi:hypothetical protein